MSTALILSLVCIAIWVPLLFLCIRDIKKFKRVKKIIQEMHDEYQEEVYKLYDKLRDGTLELEEMEQKVMFLTDLYSKFYHEIDIKLLNKKSQRRVSLR